MPTFTGTKPKKMNLGVDKPPKVCYNTDTNKGKPKRKEMKSMKYVVESFYDDAKVTVETNDSEVAILEMIQRDMAGVHAHVLDGFTGEVLAIVNNPSGENYSTQEFALMTLGVLMVHHWESEHEEEPAPFTNPNYSPATEHGGELMCVPADADLPAELVALLNVLKAVIEE